MRHVRLGIAGLVLMLMIAPWAEATRTKEALEQFALESINFIGLARDECGLIALVTDPKGYGYYVRAGNFVGRNFGRVTKISKDRIHLREIVQKPNGDWEERDAFIDRPAGQQ